MLYHCFLPTQHAIIKNRQLLSRLYKKNEVVFLQNAYPDAYYTVLRGAVSIYGLSSSAVVTEEEKMNDNRLQYGKFLVQLTSGVGFGELSFNGDGNHTPRNAGEIVRCELTMPVLFYVRLACALKDISRYDFSFLETHILM